MEIQDKIKVQYILQKQSPKLSKGLVIGIKSKACFELISGLTTSPPGSSI